MGKEDGPRGVERTVGDRGACGSGKRGRNWGEERGSRRGEVRRESGDIGERGKEGSVEARGRTEELGARIKGLEKESGREEEVLYPLLLHRLSPEASKVRPWPLPAVDFKTAQPLPASYNRRTTSGPRHGLGSGHQVLVALSRATGT